MDQTQPRALGQQSVARELRSVLFSEVIVGAASVQPKGYFRRTLLLSLGWLGAYFGRKATHPLPPTTLYLAVTTVDVRLFSKPFRSYPIEIGRWQEESYRAAITETVFSLKLDLEVERLGRIRVSGSKSLRPVFDLVVQGSAGPV